jgi:polyhydroxybutyrate depolymerase
VLLLATACGTSSEEGGAGAGSAARGSAGGQAGSQSGGASGGGASGGGGAGAPSNLGGTSSGGASDAGTGDSGSSGYTPGPGSSGCGATAPFQSGRFTIDVNGTEREYVLDVPSSYDANRPYRLIFALHWVSVTANAVVTGEPGEYGGLGPYYGLKALADDSAIFVAPEGIDNGWLNEDDIDIDFVRAMLDELNANLCIDQERIFSTGFSYGGMMSIAIGCELGDVFRAIAPMDGSMLSGCNLMKDDRVAFWGAHGQDDIDVSPDEGHAARDVFLERNHCQAQASATEPSPCVAYAGCDDGYPVQWCEFAGDHTQWPGAPAALWRFFTQF